MAPPVTARDGGAGRPAGSAGDRAEVYAHIRATLMAARQRDGGWPYRPGNRSRIEPTCWALLALGSAITGGPRVLQQWPRANGLLVDVAGAPANYAFNALAALTLLANGSADAEPIIRTLVAVKGLTYSGKSDIVVQDSSLAGWGWVDGTACWVEPTAWCVLLLKKRREHGRTEDADRRIAIGEALLFDRVCHNGGWNYGNSRVYGQDLWPYVPTTALGLLALQDRADHAVVQRSREQMRTDLMTERSVLALALAVICGRVYGEHTEDLENALVGQYVKAGALVERNVVALAMMACALSPGQSGQFRLQRGDSAHA